MGEKGLWKHHVCWEEQLMDPSPALTAWQGSLCSFCPHQPPTPDISSFPAGLGQVQKLALHLVPKEPAAAPGDISFCHTLRPQGSTMDQMVCMVLIPHTAKQSFPPHEIPQGPAFSTNPIYVTSKAPSHKVPTTQFCNASQEGKGHQLGR